MKTLYFTLLTLAFYAFTTIPSSEACAYAGSNIDFVKTQTLKAIEENTLDKAHYYTYRAINAFEKSKNQLNECGCTYALKSISEGFEHLKLATKSTSIDGTRILLNKALEHTRDGLEFIEQHEFHDSTNTNDALTLNTITSKEGNTPEEIAFYKAIDTSLLKYEASLNHVIDTVNCKEAYAFAMKIYLHCEQELLQEDLSEGKKYYNLKTKEITSKALERIGDCEPNE